MRDRDSATLLSVAWLIALVHVIAPAPAFALETDELQQILHVRAGATCLSAEALAPLVEQWVYGEPLPKGVVIEVEGDPRRATSASFRVVAGGQTIAHRAFDPGPPRCEYLRAALSLAIALALKVSLMDELGRPEPDDPARDGMSLSAAALASYDVLPGFAPGAELRAQYAFGETWALRLGALGLLSTGVELERTGVRVDAGIVAGRVDTCVRGRFSNTLQARVCAGLLAGALYARGRGGGDRRTALLGWVALTNAVALTWSISEHWFVDLELGLSAPLRRLRIGVQDTRGQELEARALPAVGLVLGLGPSYRF